MKRKEIIQGEKKVEVKIVHNNEHFAVNSSKSSLIFILVTYVCIRVYKKNKQAGHIYFFVVSYSYNII